ncbi:2,3-bisphosphoglycerate-independent phosphoglycerate mutase [bacterium]|nr:2,3-bisphosphoglycerate-independent phosphoglycerate mutase [bacterium]
MVKQKVLLIILDGLGVAPKSAGNAVVLANVQNLSTLWNTCPHTYLLASGEAVGLPKNVKGNSEVGHMNLGSGRVVFQSLSRIDNAIAKGMLAQNTILNEAYTHATKYGGRIHIIGLLSDGAVHSHINHFKEVLNYFSKRNFNNQVYIHAFTDGRDTGTKDAAKYLADMDKHCMNVGMGRIGTFVGRYYGMDRNNKWERTQKAYSLLMNASGEKYDNYVTAISTYYDRGLTDEFLEPTVLDPNSKISENDAVIFMNFRADRMLQIIEPFINPNFMHFDPMLPKNLYICSMIEYRRNVPKNVIFPRQYINLTLGKVLEHDGKRQLRISETEKYAHVTYFFNGGIPQAYEREDRILVESPKVPTYDLKPEMSAIEVTNTLLQKIQKMTYDFTLVNFANPDMVGHTGNIPACVKAIQVVDYCVGTLVREFTGRGGVVMITADHGNAEEMLDLQTGEMDTEHSINPVSFIMAGSNIKRKGLPYGALKDVAPTVLDVMGIPIPLEMTGESLIRKV